MGEQLQQYPTQDGVCIKKTITLSANNTSATENIFKVNGSVEILKLCGLVVDTTTMVNLTAVKVELYDGTTTDDITADGIVLSGLAVGTLMVKTGLKAAVLSLADNASGVVTEAGADKKVYQSFFVTQKASTDTYIRVSYTTTDAPINCQIEWAVRYNALDGGYLEIV